MVHKQGSATLMAVGDIIVARKDFKSSFAGVSDVLKQADISFFNNETPYASVGSPGMAQHGAVPHDPAKMTILPELGFNVCTMANNHTLDWGVDAVIECRQRLAKLGIAVCGAGKNVTEAHQPAFVEKNGVRVAFLGYLSVGPNGYMAEEDKPGAAMVRAHTLYESNEYQPGTPPKILTWPYKEDLAMMVEDIKKVRKQADIVVMTDHWGIHNAPVIIPDYEYEVAYAAIDAGADLVLGTHPHILKAVEVYKGKVIIHSLANFVMESGIAQKEGENRGLRLKSWAAMNARVYRPRHPDQSKSFIVKAGIENKKISRVSLLPVMLDLEWANPELLPRTDVRAQEIFQYMVDITQGVGLTTRYSWDGDEIAIGT